MDSPGRANDPVDIVTRIAMKSYSRRGLFRVLGKAGLLMAGLAAGVGVPTLASACIYPPPSCMSACTHCATSCSVYGKSCMCPCPFDCQCVCQQAVGTIVNLCALQCDCPQCASC